MNDNDLIRRKDAIARTNQLCHGYEVEEWLKAIPAVEPKRGEWATEYDNGERMYRCLVCNRRMYADRYDDAVGTLGYRYCPYCGADMRGESDETD